MPFINVPLGKARHEISQIHEWGGDASPPERKSYKESGIIFLMGSPHLGRWLPFLLKPGQLVFLPPDCFKTSLYPEPRRHPS